MRLKCDRKLPCTRCAQSGRICVPQTRGPGRPKGAKTKNRACCSADRGVNDEIVDAKRRRRQTQKGIVAADTGKNKKKLGGRSGSNESTASSASSASSASWASSSSSNVTAGGSGPGPGPESGPESAAGVAGGINLHLIQELLDNPAFSSDTAPPEFVYVRRFLELAATSKLHWPIVEVIPRSWLATGYGLRSERMIKLSLTICQAMGVQHVQSECWPMQALGRHRVLYLRSSPRARDVGCPTLLSPSRTPVLALARTSG